MEEPFGAYSFAVGIGFGFHHLGIKLYGYFYVEHAGYHGELLLVGERLEAGHDRDRDAMIIALLNETEVVIVVEEHLGSDIVAAEVYFALEVEDVGVHVWRLEVLLRVAGNADAEVCLSTVDDVFFHVAAIIEVYYLAYEVFGIAVTMDIGGKELLTYSSIATECEDVLDAQEVEVDKGVLGLCLAEAAADEVRDSLNLVFIHKRSTNAHGAGALADLHPLQAAIFAGLEYLLRTVIGNIYECRVELHQRIEMVVYGCDALALGWWQDLKGYNSVFCLREVFCYFHNRWQKYN